MATKLGSIDPSKFPDEVFDLYSIPAFDQGESAVIPGNQIGSAKQIVQTDDVMLSKIVPHIRRAWIVGKSKGYRTIASGEWIVFRSKKFDNGYLRQVLVSDLFNKEFMGTVAGVGGSLLRARPAHVAKIKIPLPPLPEQRRIAAILDKGEALRAKRRAALAKLEQLAQSIFLEMFGDPATNHGRFEFVELSAACISADDIKCGPFGTQLSKSEFTEIGIPLWGIKNVNARFEIPAFEFISEKTARRLEQYSIVSGDIIMTRKGTIGNCAVYPASFPSGVMHSDLLRIRTSAGICNPVFLSHQLHYSKDIERQIGVYAEYSGKSRF